MKFKFQSEEVLAEKIVEWLKSNGWEVYQEVEIKSYSKIADIVAVKNKKCWVIETKLNFGFKVLAQADNWKNKAHYVSVAVPFQTSDSFKEKIAKNLNIGVLTVSKHYYQDKYEVVERVNSIINQFPSYRLINGLYEAQKTYAKAGTSGGHYTPYKHTIQQLEQLVTDNPGILVKKAIEKIDHHYASDKNACNSIVQWIHKGSIKSLRIVKQGRKNCLFKVISL